MLSKGGVVNSDRQHAAFEEAAMYCLRAEGGNMFLRAG